MMRQAGRYLEEYRKIRASHSFLDVCETPELAVEVSLQPLEIVGVDAVILFSDILTPLAALGVEFDLDHGGPRIHHPITGAEDVAKLIPKDPRETCPYVFETLRILQRELEGKVPLIGFCGAPFTLAAYLVEGGGSKDYGKIKRMAHREPQVLHPLLEKLAETMAQHLEAQVEAGAQIVQIFDTWAGQLAVEDYETFALPYEKAIIQRLQAKGVPVVLYVRGATGWLERLRETGADVISLDWRVPIAEARQRLGADQVVQGNLDPGVLLGHPDHVRERALKLYREGGGRGHIMNLGHGILPSTPRECAKAFVEAAQQAREVAT